MAEVKKTAHIEEVIQKMIGIKPGANDLTPMDYGEAKKVAIEYSNQVNAELLEALEKAMKYVEKYEDPTGWLVHILEADKKEMRAAIKRARGL